MIDIKSFSVRAFVMDMIKQRFDGFALWDRIEADIAIMCSSLPEAVSDERKTELIKGLEGIRQFLIEKEVEPKELIFLDEEIERYQKTKQISLYVEEEDLVPQNIIEKYVKLGYGSEGIVGIHLGYNYEQLKRLTNGVYKATGLIKFYVSKEKTLYGKIIAEIYDYPQKIPIATLVESKKSNKETGDPLVKKIMLFGEKLNTKEYVKIKEIEAPFYVYRFVTEYNQDLILLSVKQLDIGDYIITGTITQIDDYKALTDSARLPTKLPYIFAQTVRNRIIKFKDHQEFRARLRKLDINKVSAFNVPFTVRKHNHLYLLKQPNWFKWLIWSWLCHAPVGLFNDYPLHIMILGPKHSGKSELLNTLHARSKESRKIFAGTGSTMKNLVPSFKYNPAKLGYLAESNRFAFCDEFLRCLAGSKSNTENTTRAEGVAIMNDLLEHQKREAGSGVSSVNVNMTSRVIAATNPIKGIHNTEDLLRMFDESWLSRWLIYYQPQEHVRLIRQSKDSTLKTTKYDIKDNDWVAILDYLHTFHATYDMDRVEAIKDKEEEILSETLKNHYDARHMHHIECLMDGIVKARCVFERDMAFLAQDQDYEMLTNVWQNVIGSWLDGANIRDMPIRRRVFYLPEDAQFIYWKIVKFKRPVLRGELEGVALKEMNKKRYVTAMVILIDNQLLLESDEAVRPHYMTQEDGEYVK